MKNNIIILIIFFFCFKLFAIEVQYLARSPKALLMGDAFTAIADDNPAALGRNKGVSFTPMAPNLGLTNALNSISKFQNLPSTPAGIASRFMDYPINFSASLYPTVKMQQFALTMFLNNRTSIVFRNSYNPTMGIDYRYDRGFITGFAFNVLNGATTKKGKKGAKSVTSSGERLSVGFGIKHMNRQGLSSEFDLIGTKLLSTITGGNTSLSSIKTALGYAQGSAWGYDMGAEYALSNGPSLFTAGLSVMDIGNTYFTKTEGTGTVPKQEMFFNAGVAFKQDFGAFDYTISADLHPILGPVDFARQLHLGAELGIPFITLLAGFSEGYLSYGLSFKIWPFKITTGFYSVETGAAFRQQESSRFLLYVSLFDFSIDL